jgi:hypothetical protein
MGRAIECDPDGLMRPSFPEDDRELKICRTLTVDADVPAVPTGPMTAKCWACFENSVSKPLEVRILSVRISTRSE